MLRQWHLGEKIRNKLRRRPWATHHGLESDYKQFVRSSDFSNFHGFHDFHDLPLLSEFKPLRKTPHVLLGWAIQGGDVLVPTWISHPGWLESRVRSVFRVVD